MEADEILGPELKYIEEILFDGDLVRLQQLKQRQTFCDLLTHKGSELISCVSSFMNSKRIYECPETVVCCREILEIIAAEVDPKDSFITFLEQLDEESCSLEKFMMFLPPLRISLEKLAKSRQYWLEWALSTIKYYLNSLSVPEDRQAEFDVEESLVSNRYVDKILALCRALLIFFDAFVENYISEREKDALIVFGLQLLAEPAMYVCIKKFEEMQLFCVNTIANINKLTSNIHLCLDHLDERYLSNLEKDESLLLKEDSDERPSIWARICPLNLAVYYSALISETPFLQYFPQVYERLYLFHKLLFLCIVLLRHTHNVVVRKGLHLSACLLKSMELGSIPHYYLEHRVHRDFLKIICSVSVFSSCLENRREAIRLLLPHIRLLDAQGRYTLYMNVSSITDNPDVDGEIITSFRNDWLVRYNSGNLEFYQKGKHLIDVLKSFCVLPDLSNNDIMIYKDKILAVVYLFALLVRMIGVDGHFDYFEKTYLSVVADAVKKSRRSFSKDLHYLQNNNQSDSARGDVQFGVVVDGQQLPQLRHEEKIEATKCALTALDLIDHSLALVYQYAKREPSQ